MSDELGGSDLLASLVVDVTDLDGEAGGLLAVSSGVDEGGGKDGSSAEVARGLERRLPWDLTVGGELAANAEGRGEVCGQARAVGGEGTRKGRRKGEGGRERKGRKEEG